MPWNICILFKTIIVIVIILTQFFNSIFSDLHISSLEIVVSSVSPGSSFMNYITLSLKASADSLARITMSSSYCFNVWGPGGGGKGFLRLHRGMWAQRQSLSSTTESLSWSSNVSLTWFSSASDVSFICFLTSASAVFFASFFVLLTIFLSILLCSLAFFSWIDLYSWRVTISFSNSFLLFSFFLANPFTSCFDALRAKN